MLCHIHLFLVWGLAPGPKPRSPGPRRELVFDLGAGTWPKASEPWARAGELALGLPPRPRALRLRARCQNVPNQKKQQKQTKRTHKSKETKKLDFLFGGPGWGAGSEPPSPAQVSEIRTVFEELHTSRIICLISNMFPNVFF